jgi:hypothetical protein
VLFLVHRFLSSWWRRRQVTPKRRFLQEPHGVTTQKTPFFCNCIVFDVVTCTGNSERRDIRRMLSSGMLNRRFGGMYRLHYHGDKNRRTRNNGSSNQQPKHTANVVDNSPILSLWWWRRYVLPKRRFLQEPYGITSQKTAFFIVTTVKTSNLT